MAKCYASKVVEYAKSQVGVKETGTNINKYAADIDKNHPDFYNMKKQGVEWCDIFVDDCFIHCYGETEARRLLCQPKKSAGAGCKYSYAYYKAKKQVGKTPTVGAQAFFGASEATLSHTGLVVKVTKDRVYTVEGNKNNRVSSCDYPIKTTKIYGYGYPAFDKEPAKAAEPAKKEETKVIEQKPESASTPAPVNTYTVTAEHGLNLRTKADTSDPKTVICVMPKGAKFTVSKTSGKWAYGTYNKKTGWANLAYLKK